jgi:cytochrome c oxidase cbb3-type subunit III
VNTLFGRFVRQASYVLLFGSLCACAGLACQRKPRENPAPANPELARGGELYQRMCAVCHGASGEGYKADRAPRLSHPDFLGSVSDEFLRRAIANGRAKTTMSAWAKERGGPLSKSDIDAVILYVKTLGQKAKLKLDERPLAGSAAAAEAEYTRSCAPCHGPRGRGGISIQIGDPELLATASNGFLRHAIAKGRFDTPMPGFEKMWGSARVEDMVALVRTFSQPAPAPVALPVDAGPIPLGPVPLNPKGPEPAGFKAHPGVTALEVVKAAFDKRARFALLDARAPSDYMFEHIAGAVSVPFYDPKPYLASLPKNAWLVCYCSCPHAESGRLAEQLVANGFKKVTVLDEGLGVWKHKQYPTRTGREP